MHILTVKKAFTDALGVAYAEGSYLCEDITAFQSAIEADRGTATVSPAIAFASSGNVNDAEAVVLVTNAGWGDLLMLTPALRAFAAKHPNKPLAIACPTKRQSVFEHLSFSPWLVDYPLPIAAAQQLLESGAMFVTTEHVQEETERGRTRHAIDLKADILGVSLTTDEERKTDYIVTAEEMDWAVTTYAPIYHNGARRKRIGIQMAASSPTRSYHPKLMGEVLKELTDAGHELMLFGSPGSLGDDLVPKMHRDTIRNLAADRLTFRQSAAVLQTCDAVLAPDSSLMHLAGALEIPCVALFGSTHWNVRTSTYKTVRAIQGNGGCPIAPCFHHPKGTRLWPKDAPCSTAGHCGVLNSIDPARVVREIERKLKGE
jgi:ADP-heptose:LPS heptosyltransferase